MCMCVYAQQLLIPVLRTAGEGRDWEQLPWCRGEKQHFPPDTNPAGCSPAGPRPEPPGASASPRPRQTELQESVLYHIDACVRLARSEDVVSLTEPLEDHVAAELQEEWLLKVAQHPGQGRRGNGDMRRSGQSQLCNAPACTLTLTGHS